MSTYDGDIIVIGAGIAGATAAAHLAEARRVTLIEAEEAAGYHTTGRSAAMWIQNYGPGDVRVLTGLSRSFFEAPPLGFTDVPLMSRRAVLTVAPEGQLEDFAAGLAGAVGVREISPEAARALVPALREGYVRAASVEDDTFDMDVAALHQGFLRRLARLGGVMRLRSRSMRIARVGADWEVEVTGGDVVRAPVLVNAAGAWGDEVAGQAGAAPGGLVPKRRTGVIIDPQPWAVAEWPMMIDAGSTFYARPEARTRLMVSPVDETPMAAQDIQPDELDIAIAVDRLQVALDVSVTRVERAWAGLRSFVPDGHLCVGWDPVVEGFFWSVGQGGYGIQTSPAAGKLVADLVLGRDPGAARDIVGVISPQRFST